MVIPFTYMENWFKTAKDTLLEKTEQGLLIIAECIPWCDITKVNAKQGTKAFKSPFRNERTPSCNLFFSEKSNSWGITDFGDEGYISAFDLYLKLNNISQNDVATGLLELCMRFNVPVEKGQPILKQPKISHADRSDKNLPFDYKPCEWTNLHFAVFNPKANSNTDEGRTLRNEILAKAEFYGLEAVEWYAMDVTYQDKPMRRKVEATTVFPLFIWIQGKSPNQWGKIYQPYASESKHRFFYFGHKPERFIYGLAQLQEAFDKKRREYKETLEVDEVDSKVTKRLLSEFKLPEVIICSGGSDGINISALGFYAMWSNSENNFILPAEYREIKKFAHEIYYVGDIDDTGKKMAHNLGLQYTDIRIIRLPEKLKQHRGWRGKEAKDVKDYCRYYSASDFRGLLQIACPYQFWSYRPGSKAASPYQFEPMWALHFLREHGFYKFKNKSKASGYDLIRVEGQIVTKLEPDEVKSFMKDWAIEKRFNKEIINLIIRTKAIREEFVRDLPWFEGSFKRHSADCQYWAFPQHIWKITADKCEVIKQGKSDVYFWSDKVYSLRDFPDHEINILPDLFTVKKTDDDQFEITDIKYDNQYLQFLINTAKIHHTKEFRAAGESTSIIQTIATEKNLNTLTGENLSEDERNEQVLHFLSRISMIGYLLHTNKAMSKAWAPWITENHERDAKEAHGGTGKSLMMKKIHEILLNSVWKDGRNIKDEKFLFGSVDRTHEMFVVADADRSISIGPYFNAITDGIENRTLYSLGDYIPFEDAPKIVFISNYFPWDMSPSDHRRLWPIGFSDYYHSVGGLFTEERNPGVDFGRELYSSWTASEWVEWFNLMRQCIQVWLKYGRIDPPMAEMNRQIARTNMGSNFESWAPTFLDQWLNELPAKADITKETVGEHIYLPVKVALHEYSEYLRKLRQSEKPTQAGFIKKVEAYAKYNGWICNPMSIRNSQNRMQRKVTKTVMNFLSEFSDKCSVVHTNDIQKHPSEIKWDNQIHIKHNVLEEMIYLACYADKMKIQEVGEDEGYVPPTHDAF